MDAEIKQISGAAEAFFESLPGKGQPTTGQAEFLKCSPEQSTVVKRCLLAATFATIARERISTIAKNEKESAANLSKARGFATAYFRQLALLGEEMQSLKSYKNGDDPIKTMRTVATWCSKVGFSIVPEWEDSLGARSSAASVVNSLHATMVSICGGNPLAPKGGRA